MKLASRSPWSDSHRSQAPFDIPASDTTAVIRVTGYRRPDLVQAVLSFPYKSHAAVRDSLTTPFPLPESSSPLGALAVLPLELLGQVLLCHTDVRSVAAFRGVNRRARHVVASLHEYQAAMSHALDFVCALFRTGLAASLTLEDVHAALTAEACVACGRFGGFVSLPRMARCCFTCLQSSPCLRVQTLDQATGRKRTATQREERQLAVRSLPGRYSTWAIRSTSRLTIVATGEPSDDEERDDVDAATTNPPEVSEERLRFMAACAVPYYDTLSGEAEPGIACAGCQLALSKRMIAGDDKTATHDMAERMYTKKGFLEHFRWCRQAQLLWTTSGSGRFQPPELPLMAKMASL